MSTGNHDRYIPFLVFFIIYITTRSQNLSITHDSAEYLLRMSLGHPDLHPNHLFYQHFLLVLSYPLRLVFSLQQSIGILGAFAGAASLQIVYNILTIRFGVLRKLAFASICLIGFSYTIWYYSVAIEIYIYTLFFLLMAFCLLLKSQFNWKTIVLCAIFQSIAIFFHQASILFGFVAITAILTYQSCELSTRIKMLLAYISVGFVLVGFSYLSVAANLGKLDSPAIFLDWLIWNGNAEAAYSGFSFQNIILVIVGFSRAVISFCFVFVNPGVREALSSAFSKNSLNDEFYLAQFISDFTAVVLTIASLCLMVTLVWIAVKAVSSFVLDDSSRISRRELLLFLSWLLPYSLFFTVFDPSNVDFWMIQFVLIAMLLTIGLAQYKDPQSALTLVCLGAFLVCLINGVGIVLPARNSDSDYYHQLVNLIDNRLSENDVLLIANTWPLTHHLGIHSDVKYITLSDSFYWDDLSIEDVIGKLESVVQSDGDLYVASDVYDIATSGTELSGEEFPIYTRKISEGFCSGEKTTLLESWYVINVPCVQEQMLAERAR